MERLNTHIGTLESALQEAPEVLDSIGMHVSPHILNGMIHDLMGVFTLQPFVRHIGISEQIATWFNVASNFSMKASALHIRQYLCPNLAMLRNGATLQHAHDNRLARSASAPDLLPALVSVHIASEAADEGFIRFNSSTHLFKRAGLCRQAQTMQHEPGGFLRDAKSTTHFVGTNPILAVDDHPHGRQPLVETNGGIFHDRTDFDAELLPRMTASAFPHSTRGEEYDLLASACGTGDAVRPAQLNHKLQGAFSIREVVDSLNQGLGVCVYFHDPILAG